MPATTTTSTTTKSEQGLTEFLENVDASIFPLGPVVSASKPVANSSATFPCYLPSHLPLIAHGDHRSAEHLLQLAWALVLRHYLGADSVRFGYLFLPEAPPGPVMPQQLRAVCAVLKRTGSLTSTLHDWSNPAICRLVEQSHLALKGEASTFNTALVIGGGTSSKELTLLSSSLDLPIVGCVTKSVSQVNGNSFGLISVSCNPRLVVPIQQNLLAQALQAAVSAVLLGPRVKLQDLQLLTIWDQQRLAEWNHKDLISVDHCVHRLFQDTAVTRGEAAAIASWDGDLTYTQLDDDSSVLASKLQAEGLGLGSVVALCFSKSTWAVVSMLAVLKAGATFVSIDPKQPEKRKAWIVQDAKAAMVLSSDEHAADLKWSALNYMVVSRRVIEKLLLDHPHWHFDDIASPRSAAYLVYTSGSTGTPKGVVVEHAALCTGVAEQARAMEIDAKARVLQFADYSFDVSIGDIFTTLTHGACLCIPSEAERKNDLARAMTKMSVTHACLTSTIAGLLEPSDVPTLKVLTLGGEPASRQNLVKWADKVRLNNIYGPAECTIWCTVQKRVQSHGNEAKIGRGIGSKAWVVHPHDTERLMPLGAVGELLIEGPLLARGYLNNPEKTAASFIVDPTWRSMFKSAVKEGVRLYKTGDLVRYDVDDGALLFVGRKDMQIKLRGQRIELGEIEYHLRCVLAELGVDEMVVDMVRPSQPGDPLLAAFIKMDKGLCSDETGSHAGIAATAKAPLAAMARIAARELAKFLPSYMIPSAFVPLQSIPVTVSGKTDRRKLGALCSHFSRKELLSFALDAPAETREMNGSTASEKTASEAQMAEEWAKLLGLSPDGVHPDDSFLELGGDSLTAIYLVAKCRARGLSLSVADILQDPRLSHIAACAAPIDPSSSSPTDELEPAKKRQSGDHESFQDRGGMLLSEVAEQCGVSASAIAGVYPCTPLQEEMMDLSLRGRTTQFAHECVRLWPDLDLAQFKTAWEGTVQRHPLMRTRFIRSSHDGSLRQVVINEALKWEAPRDFDEYMSTNFAETLQPGQRLARWALYREEKSRDDMLIISLHHSLFDGITLRQIFGDQYMAYLGSRLSDALPSFGRFLRLAKVRDETKAMRFWREYLTGWEEAGSFPLSSGGLSLSRRDYSPGASKGTSRFLSFEGGTMPRLGNITLSTLLRGSWGLLLSRRTRRPSVLFSTFLAGRNVAMSGIEELAAPTFAHVPIMARLGPDQTVRGFLAQLQQEAISMIPYENTGIRAIASACSSGSSQSAATDYLTWNLLVIQPMLSPRGKMPPMPESERDNAARVHRPFPGEILCGPRIDPAAMAPFNPFPLLTECSMMDDGVVLRVSWDEQIVRTDQVESILDEFAEIILVLPGRLDDALRSV